MLLLLGLLAAGQAATPPKPTAPATLQQQFDAASDAAATPGKCAEAVAAFEAIERSGAAKRNALVAAAIDVRKGRCLVMIGRDSEGEAAIRRGLPQLEARGASFANDVRDATIMLGTAAYRRFDYDAAIVENQAALDQSFGVNRILPLLQLARSLMFDRDGRALRYAEEALAIVRATPTIDKRDVARVQTVYARVLLNQGRDKEAYAVLRDSLAKQGGLDTSIRLDDIATRSDLAIAALRNKDMDNARRYLAYTGAGRMKDTPFSRAVAMDPPACDPAAGLSPDDMAVVEFTLEDDGHVADVATVFTTGQRPTAIAFAQAVSDWSWRAEDAKAIPLIFRASTRVELRCLRAPQGPSLYRPLADAVTAWFASRGITETAWEGLPDARALPLQRAAASGEGVLALRGALSVALNPAADEKEQEAMRQQVQARSAALQAPPAVRVLALVWDQKKYNATRYREGLRAALAEPGVAADPIAAGTLRLSIAAPGFKSRSPADAMALLDGVITSPLPDTHPLKVAALLQQANLLAAANDFAGAQAAFQRTGLTAEQCSLVGLRPATTRTGASSDDYPMAAVRMGFEGWVRTEFDVTADGRTGSQRAVISYPPFIFDEAAVGVLRDARFTSSYRPAGALACSGQQQSMVFRLP
ncbi:energy transducer TonB [Sphingomonas radiodurans]|uniref:energy transducer TonB n=1 Tax=Sphingomonas radiodurans TaxID=2890321 RepID=UPI001E4CB48F|nr:energy transducer TonB [Sphingomonas radiodurans]WBH17872.1 energy transducer TonB [Sphingomonas radiodurans]